MQYLWSTHLLPVLWGQKPDLVLRDEVLQDLGNVMETGFVLFKADSVDQSCQLVHFLPRTLVVAPQILGQLLNRNTEFNLNTRLNEVRLFV